MDKEKEGSFMAGIFGLTIMVCIIMLTINSCKIRKQLEGGNEQEEIEEITEQLEEVTTNGIK